MTLLEEKGESQSREIGSQGKIKMKFIVSRNTTHKQEKGKNYFKQNNRTNKTCPSKEQARKSIYYLAKSKRRTLQGNDNYLEDLPELLPILESKDEGTSQRK